MNEEIDDTEFFHQDFTTASDWEIFIARLEEIINQWKTDDLNNDESLVVKKNIWDIRSERLTFADFDFNLSLHRKKVETPDSSESGDVQEETRNKNPIDSTYDFELYDENNVTEASCLSSWYGLNEFLVLSPSNNVGISAESKIKMLLSSAYVVTNNLNCNIPFFVQIREKWQNCYLGVYEGEGIRTNFEMIHLRRGPPHCQYLSGLLDLFKTKLMSPCTTDNITVSLQQSYTLTDFGNFVWKQDFLSNDNFDVEVLFLLPFGVTIDPISTLIFKATWSNISSEVVMDTEFHSGFDPMMAPKWSCIVKATNEPLCLLGESLSEFLQNLDNNANIFDILGDFTAAPLPESNPLDVLTEPTVPNISSLLTRAARSSLSRNRKGNPPISDSVLVSLLYFLFPDADESSNFPYGGKEDKEFSEKAKQENEGIFKNLEEEFKGFKTCGVDSLTWRLSIVLAHALQSLGGVRAFAHVWYEFVQEMRYRWEKSMPIPGLLPGFPDLRTCLLNQKLQMLNCCIDRKLSRENMQSSNYDSAEDSSTDEEFFDCDEEEDTKRKEKFSLWNQPVGRLTKFGDLKLLKTGDPLYIPITQDPMLKTEDQLEEDTDILLKLGSDAEASELRAKIMSASLLSDMESFKAANPGSVVEDFIRWYSPRDWIEEEELDEWGQKKGHLSPRMLIEENNIWVETWESAKPVPANRQRRLFDDTREAEKILQFLDYRSISQICELIIPVLAHAAIYRLVEECQLVSSELTGATVKINSLLRHGERISRDSQLQLRRFEVFIQEVSSLELLISQINSLQYKFNPSGAQSEVLSNLVANLIVGREVEIENVTTSAAGNRIVTLFSDAQRVVNVITNEQAGESGHSGTINTVFPPPSEREFVLRAAAVRPACYSARCPQFMRAVLNKNEFRIAGAFSEDIVFF